MGWPDSLDEFARFDEAVTLTESLLDQASSIIQLHCQNEMLQSKRIISQIPRSRAAHAFRTVSSHLFYSEVLELCRLWDKGAKDRKSIRSVTKLLQDINAEKLIDQTDQQKEAELRKNALRQAIATSESFTASDQFESMINFRDTLLAHSLDPTE